MGIFINSVELLVLLKENYIGLKISDLCCSLAFIISSGPSLLQSFTLSRRVAGTILWGLPLFGKRTERPLGPYQGTCAPVTAII
jgi:hypothetical protein